MPYIPRGYIGVAEALRRIIEASGTPPMAPHDALRRLREALAEGDLTASLQPHEGLPWPVEDVTPWRTDHGLRALRSGRLLWRTGLLGNVDVEGDVLLPMASLEAWLNPPVAPGKRKSAGPASQAECDREVLAQYEAAFASGDKLTRDAAFDWNKNRERPFSETMLKAAIRAVPARLKRAQGETRKASQSGG